MQFNNIPETWSVRSVCVFHTTLFWGDFDGKSCLHIVSLIPQGHCFQAFLLYCIAVHQFITFKVFLKFYFPSCWESTLFSWKQRISPALLICVCEWMTGGGGGKTPPAVAAGGVHTQLCSRAYEHMPCFPISLGTDIFLHFLNSPLVWVPNLASSPAG